ncbi:MAG: heavy metal translocating P-type ATPase [Devosia sp.]
MTVSASASSPLRYRVGGMDCASCATKIETAVRRLPGVADVGVSVAAGTLRVDPAPGLSSRRIEAQVRDLGYTIAPLEPAGETPDHGTHAGHTHDHDHDHAHADLGDGPFWRTPKAIATLLCGAALALAFSLGQIVPAIGPVALIAALLVGLVPIARRALSAARAGTPFSIETLMSIAAVGAVIIGATEEAAIVVLLFLVGELLEGIAAGRARASIRALADLVPRTALLERNGETSETPADRLALGDVILVRPGDRIAADGVIIAGRSAINEAPVTGESLPRDKGVGDTVYAGTINADAALRVKVSARAQDNTIARIIRLVEEAQEAKAPTQRFIDRFSRYYTPAVLAAGALVATLPPLLFGQDWGTWVYRGLALLLIGCPCALVISTPAAIAAGLSAGARRGLLVKGGAVLEALRKATTIAFDKTGTLTEGKPKVTDIVAIGRSEAQILSLAAAIAAGSSHPLALAIREAAKARAVPVPPASAETALPGRGVSGKVGGVPVMLVSPSAADAIAPLPAEIEARIAALSAEGKTVSVLLYNGKPAGLIAMRDEPRADTRDGLARFSAMRIETLMLTGDNPGTAEAIGRDLGIAVRAGLLPEDKQAIVRDLQAKGQIVVKVGDGINDAPALAAADIGVAMGGGTDVALETADAAVLHGRVTDVARLIDLSKATMGNIHQNIAIALGLKAVFLVTTIIGVTGLWPAILADTGATVLVTANAMRLLAWRGK